MIRQDFSRIDAKRKSGVDYRKKQFAAPAYASLEYKSRLNFYVQPPTADITLEQFEQWAIDRLRGLFLLSLQFTNNGNDDLFVVDFGRVVLMRRYIQYSRNSKPAPSGTNRQRRQQAT
jgi:hypothetical protein